MGLLSTPLDEALSSRAKVRLLRLFIAGPEPMSAREAARRVGMAKRSVDLALRDLVRVGVIRRQGSGPQPSYLLNPHHALVRHALCPLFLGSGDAREDANGGERGAVTELFATLRDAVEVPGQAAPLWAGVYGSSARGTDDIDSDIDLAVIVKSEQAAEAMRQRLAEMLPIFRTRFGRVLSPVVLTRTQIRGLARSGHPLAHGLEEGRFVAGQARDVGSLLHGAE